MTRVNSVPMWLAPWGFTVLVGLSAFVWTGWSAWLRWYLLLIAGVLLAHALLQGFLQVLAQLTKWKRVIEDIRLLIAIGLVAAILGSWFTVQAFGYLPETSRQIKAQISTPAKALTEIPQVAGVGSADQSPEAHRQQQYEIIILFAFTAIILVLRQLQQAARMRAAHSRQMIALKLSTLQAQIEPHFIYNTLANVQQLVRTQPERADTLLGNLITYLKSAVPMTHGNQSTQSTVDQELTRAQAYLDIMRMRMGERLHYAIHVPDKIKPLTLPPLCVMTLVENAVRHGIDPLPEGGTITIRAELLPNKFLIHVEDNGAGFADAFGNGMGLTNLRERLATQYQEHAQLLLSHHAPRGVCATLELPID